jgi:mono/diheme cytochrome c family protein
MNDNQRDGWAWTRNRKIAAVCVAVAVLAAIAAVWLMLGAPTVTGPESATLIPTDVLTRSVADGKLRRGQYMLRAGDCMVCHTKSGGAPFAGGYALETPFGTIYSVNITPDAATGIGNMSADQFYATLHNGVGSHGPLYPAMPYTSFTWISREDSDAMFAYLRTLASVNAPTPSNALHFPFNIRFLLHFWNVLNFSEHAFAADPSKSADWNRGAYLALGPGHCATCHTPKNALAGDENGRAYQGGLLSNWFAPDLTSNVYTGLGSWSAGDIAEYLKTGRNAYANAAGPMADVVTYSTSLLSDQDRTAIATYIKSLPFGPDVDSMAPDPDAMKRGAAVYSDNCTSCHMENGIGQARFFPPLKDSRVAQQGDPTTLLHLILAGGRTGPTPTRPSALSMPTFGWKLTDREIAEVSTYVRNSWGNRGASVTAKQVKVLRANLGLNAASGVRSEK